ncbi:hypothetical protein HD597_004309 [Nonomuraea thailandensis]|uniref:Cyclophilin-like domain-containing protein n=1 Tax=Nonomuraea thailandensis TaxID=1188745 RepID=A0A9X2GGW8_9ACTN|nr:cyclophilin-like fold protein [Nonomuraea thailandensis]MCP2357289.1 hypothetical protein [Nonomuraea thailandensis]
MTAPMTGSATASLAGHMIASLAASLAGSVTAGALLAARARRLATCLIIAALIIAALAGCSTSARPPLTGPQTPGTRANTASTAWPIPVVLRFGGQAVTATLTDTPPSRQLAAMLPLTLHLTDAWGQAKAGPLPHPLDGGTPVHDPIPGEIYFWPSSQMIAVYYDDLGQAVPDPGLIRLGVITTGLDRLAEAGDRITVRVSQTPGGRA